jgi:hypothetical protein
MLKQIKNQVIALTHVVRLFVGPKTNFYEFVSESLSTYNQAEHEELGLVDGTYKNCALYDAYYEMFVQHNMSKIDLCIFLKFVKTDRPKIISPFEARTRPTIDHVTYLIARHK